MKIVIIGTGSSGNSYILTDIKGNSILLECGIPYTEMVLSPHWPGINNVDALLVTHSHKDHSLELQRFRELIDNIVYGAESDLPSEIEFDNWIVRPYRVFHNVQCHGFLIYSKAEKKSLAFFTDCQSQPKISGVQHWLYEVNYDESTAREVIEDETQTKKNHVYFSLNFHNSLENARNYFSAITKRNGKKVENIITIHGSSSYLDKTKIPEQLGNFTENIYVGENGGVYEI